MLQLPVMAMQIKLIVVVVVVVVESPSVVGLNITSARTAHIKQREMSLNILNMLSVVCFLRKPIVTKNSQFFLRMRARFSVSY